MRYLAVSLILWLSGCVPAPCYKIGGGKIVYTEYQKKETNYYLLSESDISKLYKIKKQIYMNASTEPLVSDI